MSFNCSIFLEDIDINCNKSNAGGIKNYLWENAGIRSGVYIYNGQITNKYLSNQFKLPLKDLDLLVAAQN